MMKQFLVAGFVFVAAQAFAVTSYAQDDATKSNQNEYNIGPITSGSAIAAADIYDANTSLPLPFEENDVDLSRGRNDYVPPGGGHGGGGHHGGNGGHGGNHHDGHHDGHHDSHHDSHHDGHHDSHHDSHHDGHHDDHHHHHHHHDDFHHHHYHDHWHTDIWIGFGFYGYPYPYAYPEPAVPFVGQIQCAAEASDGYQFFAYGYDYRSTLNEAMNSCYSESSSCRPAGCWDN